MCGALFARLLPAVLANMQSRKRVTDALKHVKSTPMPTPAAPRPRRRPLTLRASTWAPRRSPAVRAGHRHTRRHSVTHHSDLVPQFRILITHEFLSGISCQSSTLTSTFARDFGATQRRVIAPVPRQPKSASARPTPPSVCVSRPRASPSLSFDGVSGVWAPRPATGSPSQARLIRRAQTPPLRSRSRSRASDGGDGEREALYEAVGRGVDVRLRRWSYTASPPERDDSVVMVDRYRDAPHLAARPPFSSPPPSPSPAPSRPRPGQIGPATRSTPVTVPPTYHRPSAGPPAAQPPPRPRPPRPPQTGTAAFAARLIPPARQPSALALRPRSRHAARPSRPPPRLAHSLRHPLIDLFSSGATPHLPSAQ
ncbi:hypothetical protein B0H11DRAFT_2244567 [Mycena galericulata]|nr:hypothetical protein B0H11DRAFT_2244567 [Mycena galericulata]